jgi:hypothetical protein
VKTNGLRVTVALVLVFLQTFDPIFATPLPRESGEGENNIGIIAADLDITHGEAVAGFETKLRRKLENFAPWKPRVHILKGSLLSEEIDTESRVQLFGRLLDEWENNLGNLDDLNFEARSETLVKGLLNISRFGPLLQRYHFLKAAGAWRQSNFANYEREIRRSAFLHPFLHLPSLNIWDTKSDAFNPIAFEEQVKRTTKNLSRQCEATLRLSAADLMSGKTQITLNGFEVNANQTLVLGAAVYRVAAMVGDHRGTGELHCERMGKQELNLTLTKNETGPQNLKLAEITKKYNLTHLLVVQAKDDHIQVHLFNSEPNHFQKISLKRPVRLADVAHLDMNSVISDASLPLFRSASPPNNFLSRSVALETNASRPSDGWYNNWVFWAVAVGVLGAASAVYLGTRASNVDSPRGGVAVKFE